MGPGDLTSLLERATRLAAGSGEVLVSAADGDDAGVFRYADRALVATVDFIPPVCDDPVRFGRVAAANSISDVWAMGGRPLFALNLCAFPEAAPAEVLAAILEGAASTIAGAGAVLLGGHTVRDPELKFGLAVVGEADPARLLTHRGVRPGQALVLTKPIGTGILINAFKADQLDEVGLEAALAEMERTNAEASRLALELGATAATDVTGFGLAGHAWNLARASGVGLRIRFDALPVHERFYDLVAAGVSTGCTRANHLAVEPHLARVRGLDDGQLELLVDPQTSGGLLVALPADHAEEMVARLVATGHRAAIVGEAVAGDARLEIL